MYCIHCGKQLRDGAAFCPNCGKPVSADPILPADAPEPAASKTQAPKQKPSRKKKPVRVWLIVVIVLAALIVAAGACVALTLLDIVDIPFVENALDSIGIGPSGNTAAQDSGEFDDDDGDEVGHIDRDRDLGSLFGGFAGKAEAAAPAAPAAPAAEAAPAGNTITIGVFEPLSGDLAAGGRKELLGIQFANAECPTVEIGGITYDVRLEIWDNYSDYAETSAVAEDMACSDISIVLGSYGSGVSIAAADVFEAYGLPAIGISCSNPYVTESNDVYYRVCPLDDNEGTAMAEYACDWLGAEGVFCLLEQGSDFDTMLFDRFAQRADEYGCWCQVEYFPSGCTDFYPYLAKACEMGADAIFVPGSLSYTENIIVQCAEVGACLPLLASDWWYDDSLLDYAGLNPDLDVFVPAWYANDEGSWLEESFRAWLWDIGERMEMNGYSDQLSDVTAMAYDAYYAALEAIRQAGSADRTEILRAMPYVSFYGICGPVSFDSTGNAVREYYFIKRANAYDYRWDNICSAAIY